MLRAQATCCPGTALYRHSLALLYDTFVHKIVNSTYYYAIYKYNRSSFYSINVLIHHHYCHFHPYQFLLNNLFFCSYFTSYNSTPLRVRHNFRQRKGMALASCTYAHQKLLKENPCGLPRTFCILDAISVPTNSATVPKEKYCHSEVDTLVCVRLAQLCRVFAS